MGIPPDIEKLEDAATLVGVLYSICHEQAIRAGVTFQQFADQMTADTAKEAANAAMEELADFFTALQPAKGEVFRLMWRRTQTTEEAMKKAVACLPASLTYSESLE